MGKSAEAALKALLKLIHPDNEKSIFEDTTNQWRKDYHETIKRERVGNKMDFHEPNVRADTVTERRLACAAPAYQGTDHATLMSMCLVFLIFMIFARRWAAKPQRF